MAAKPFSKEQLNFFKFSALVFDEFPKVLRQIFVTMWDNKVSMKPGFIPWDDSTTVRNMLLTSEGGKTDIPTGKAIQEWDCTALFKATIYAKTFGVPSSKGSTLNDLYLRKVKPAPGSFHSSVQSSTGNQDETYALAIDQLRLLRNSLCHSRKLEIVKTDFDVYVQLVTNALTAVNIDASFVDVIGQMSEDDFPTEKVQKLEEYRVRELQTISMFHANIEQKIDNVEQKLSSIEKTTEKIVNVDSKLSSIEEGTDEIQTMVKKINLGEKRNVAETLPKPHIPSAVPFFTGREVEIKEITNLITDQSTRLLNIWGSPGFGKTSTAIGAAHHLVSLEYPVYFFKLHGINTVEGFLSKILSIFKSNLIDHDLKPIDKVVSIFREISCRIFLIFDNLDDLLWSESRSPKVRSIFEELLDSSVNINIIFTTRELLENLCDHIEGFQAIRIRPLYPVLSIALVRELLPAFSENVAIKVTELCSHVPLAIKVVASLVQDNTEDIANDILEELSLSGNLLDEIGSPYEENMNNLFEVLFKQLTLSDNHALISLTVFESSTIRKDAAIAVVSGEIGIAKRVRSLKTLVNKSLIDEDSKAGNYSIHPLIYSFVVQKAEETDFENILNSSNTRYCNYYLLLFEKINDDFLAGKSIERPQLQDAMEHLPTVMHKSLTIALQDLVRILSKCEIFLFLIDFPGASQTYIPELYDLAIKKCIAQQYDCSKLNVSKYFLSIISSFFVSNIDPHIPEQTRDTMLLSDGCVAKLACYEGISLFVKGKRKLGVEQIEKYLDELESCPDEQLIKCLCLQLLALYYTNLNEFSKSNNFSRKAIKVCEEIGNYNLFLINNCEEASSPGQNECKGEQLIMFLYLLCLWSKKILSVETAMHFSNLLGILEQGLGNKSHHDSHYLFLIFMYHDCMFAILGKIGGQESLLTEELAFLDMSLKSELADSTFSRLSEAGTRSSEQLLNCFILKMFMARDKLCHENSCDNVETCLSFLHLSLKHNGKQHEDTAFCYLKLGLAEAAAENYISALNAFDQVIEILGAADDGSCNSNDILINCYFEKGKVYHHIDEYELAIESFEEALKRRKLLNNGTKEIGMVLFWLGNAQLYVNELTSALATLQQALKIMVKLHADKCCSSSDVTLCYCMIAQVHHELGNNTECVNILKKALKIGADCNDEHVVEQCFIISLLFNWELDENLDLELLNCASRIITQRYKPLCACILLKLAEKQFESGKYQEGLAFLQEAFDIKLEDTLLDDANIREGTASCYVGVATTLVSIGKFKLAKRVVNRATKIAESLPECKQHVSFFYCCSLKGRIHNEMQEYVAAIKCLRHALLQLSKFSPDDIDKPEELKCHFNIGAAYFFEECFQDALKSFYNALAIVKDLFPEGSEDEGHLYLWVASVANKMTNKSLEVNNLRLAYKMNSKVLGSNHPVTEECYIAYARALINR